MKNTQSVSHQPWLTSGLCLSPSRFHLAKNTPRKSPLVAQRYFTKMWGQKHDDIISPIYCTSKQSTMLCNLPNLVRQWLTCDRVVLTKIWTQYKSIFNSPGYILIWEQSEREGDTRTLRFLLSFGLPAMQPKLAKCSIADH
jgi:hypothetical protein